MEGSKQEFETVIKSLKELIESKLDHTNFRLDSIEKLLNNNAARLVKQDSRIDDVEKANMNIYANCPNNPKIRKLEDNDLKNDSIKKWIIATAGITSTILGILIVILKLTDIL